MKSTLYLGIIEDIDDPKKIGRCKIRIHGLFGHQSSNQIKDSIPTSHIPWAYPYNNASFGTDGSSSFSTPKLSATVVVSFDGDIYHPFYRCLPDLDQGIKDIASGDYENFKAIHVDTINKIRIFYTSGDGMVIENEESIINIKNDSSIVLVHKNNTAAMEISNNRIDIIADDVVSISANNQILQNSKYIHINGSTVDVGKSPVFNAVLYQPLMTLIKQMAGVIDGKLPASPGVTSGLVEGMQQLIKSDSIGLTK